MLELAGTQRHGQDCQLQGDRERTSRHSGLTLQAGGQIPTEAAINKQVTSDIGRAEGISLPVLLVLLVLIFGSLVAASLPLAIGAIGIIGSFTALRLLTLATPVSIYSVNITTILGLGLAIDYGLFMVGRFREELHRQPTVEDAVARTVATAGRTIAVSGVTVAVALASLLLFPEVFLRSMGYGGVATVVGGHARGTDCAACPARRGPGSNVNALRVRKSAHAPRASEAAPRLVPASAHRDAQAPVAFVIVIMALLLALGSPFLRVTWGAPTLRACLPRPLPGSVTQTLARDFPGNVTAPIEALVTLPRLRDWFSSPARGRGGRNWPHTPARLSRVNGVTGAAASLASGGDVARIDLRYGARSAVGAGRGRSSSCVRDVAPPAGAAAYVGGQSAQLVDELSSLSTTLPWMALVMAAATFLLLFQPSPARWWCRLKAIAMNVLSLTVRPSAPWSGSSRTGTWAHVLGVRPDRCGRPDRSRCSCSFRSWFGLSMDYEVFLLSRIKRSTTIRPATTPPPSRRGCSAAHASSLPGGAADQRGVPRLFLTGGP